MNSNEVVKEQFYSELHSQLKVDCIHHKLLFGNFSACVGCDTSIWGGIIGKLGVGKANSNGHPLLSLCMDVSKLRNDDNLNSFQTICDNKLTGISDNTDIESAWKHQDWFNSNDPNISPLLDNNAQMPLSMDNLKGLFGPVFVGSTPILSIESNLFTDKKGIMKHWAEHFSNVLNMDSIVDEELSVTPSNAEIKKGHKTAHKWKPICDHPPAVAPTVYVDWKALKTASSFTYLGSIISNDAKMDKEIESRIRKVSSTFGKLYHRLWNSHNVSLKVKVNAYKSVVLTSLLYGAESWTLEVQTKCSISGIEAILIEIQLGLLGHLSCMSYIRIPKQLLFGQFPTGRSVGRPLLRFKDKLKDTL
uniref:Reverse transcriptase domain-containing protein n=1 Tax=Octopus bimaculoides TaxID=37653 RepID=A0A0L8HW41_OCTBM